MQLNERRHLELLREVCFDFEKGFFLSLTLASAQRMKSSKVKGLISILPHKLHHVGQASLGRRISSGI